jgi:hypothetical protein
MPPDMRRVSQETKSRPMPMGTISIQIISLMPLSETASYSMRFSCSVFTSVVSPETRTANQGSSPLLSPAFG